MPGSRTAGQILDVVVFGGHALSSHRAVINVAEYAEVTDPHLRVDRPHARRRQVGFLRPRIVQVFVRGGLVERRRAGRRPKAASPGRSWRRGCRVARPVNVREAVGRKAAMSWPLMESVARPVATSTRQLESPPPLRNSKSSSPCGLFTSAVQCSARSPTQCRPRPLAAGPGCGCDVLGRVVGREVGDQLGRQACGTRTRSALANLRVLVRRRQVMIAQPMLARRCTIQVKRRVIGRTPGTDRTASAAGSGRHRAGQPDSAIRGM